MTFWQEWHANYADPDSSLSQRLRVVQGHIRAALDAAPPGDIRAISLCAGEGRDLLGVLADHPRRADVVARLVEWDPELAARAREASTGRIDVRTGDAADLANYAGYLPADVVLTCGIFGNISDDDIHTTIAAHRQLCATGATVIWTRHRREPDLVPRICQWFAEAGFELVAVTEPGMRFGVGVHRFTGTPLPREPGAHLFTFSRMGEDVSDR
ncbi:MAG TPA: class I SAM-dependent methyltransferase [Micromonosporaceae bacterium]|jgi:hypothetical protein